jgi:hypothetical protein
MGVVGVAEPVEPMPQNDTLRARVIRLAAARPDLRARLLPLLQEKTAGAPLQVGRTILSDNGMLRIHRYESTVVVTDLTNAGKRGKRCMEARLWDTDMIRDPEVVSDMERILSTLADSPTYQAAANRLRGFVVSVEMFSSGTVGIPPKFDERELRGVDVTPAGFAPVEVETDEFSLRSDYNDFVIRDHKDKNNLPTCIPAAKGGKEDVKAFYRWVRDNESRLRSMTYRDVLRGMDAAGIRYHDYCAMD